MTYLIYTLLVLYFACIVYSTIYVVTHCYNIYDIVTSSVFRAIHEEVRKENNTHQIRTNITYMIIFITYPMVELGMIVIRWCMVAATLLAAAIMLLINKITGKNIFD